MHNQPLLRFAPSPNGFLHLGHAYSALITFRWATELGGSWLLRIEDIDLARTREAFVHAIFEDLSWLGLTWPEPVLVQSTRFEFYKAAAKKLQDMGLLYPCFCSRKEIRKQAMAQTDPDGTPIYPGTCKKLTPTEVARKQTLGQPAHYRLDMEKAVSLAGILTFTRTGPTPLDRPQIAFAQPARWGDVVIQRKDTPTSYHLSVVVDDAAQNITHVTRGRDLEAATDIHVLLQFLLGLPSPIYTFHRLIKDEQARKLSKSTHAQSLRALREKGWTAQAVRTHLGF